MDKQKQQEFINDIMNRVYSKFKDEPLDAIIEYAVQCNQEILKQLHDHKFLLKMNLKDEKTKRIIFDMLTLKVLILLIRDKNAMIEKEDHTIQ